MRPHSLIALVALTLSVSPAMASERHSDRDSGKAKQYGSAMAGAILSNAVVFSFNYFVGQTDFSRVTTDTIQHNLSCEWQWDQSAYQTNQIGHPYQGSTYFAAGRANGLDFYNSALVACFGSANWELFCERNEPALNDLIQTTIGGVAFGEMFHRLYLEAAATGSPLAFFVSPMSAANAWINHERPDARRGMIREMTIRSGVGYASSRREENGVDCARDANDTPTVASGILIAYGDPFGTAISVPFEQFDLDVRLAGGLDRYDCTFFSDGMLVSWAPFDETSSATSIGLALNFDCVFTDNIRFTSNALSAAVKRERALSRAWSSRTSAYAGWMMLGVGTFYDGEGVQASNEEDSRLNYGTGAAVKCSYRLTHERHGSLELATKLYAMRTFPNSVANSDGDLLCQILETRYSRPVTRHAAVFALGTYTFERCRFEKAPDQDRRSSETTLGVEWSVN